jgi:hypothetical protein
MEKEKKEREDPKKGVLDGVSLGPSLTISLYHEIIKSGKAPLHCSSFYEIPALLKP